MGEEWSQTLTVAARPTEPVAAACTAWDAAAADGARASEPARWDGPYQPPAHHWCRHRSLRPAPFQQTHRHGCHRCWHHSHHCWRHAFHRQPQPLRPALPARCPAVPGPWLPAWPGLPPGVAGSAHCPGPGRLPRMSWLVRLLQLPWPPGVRSASWLQPHRRADRPGSCSAARQRATAAVRRRAPTDSLRWAVPPATLPAHRAPRGQRPS